MGNEVLYHEEKALDRVADLVKLDASQKCAFANSERSAYAIADLEVVVMLAKRGQNAADRCEVLAGRLGDAERMARARTVERDAAERERDDLKTQLMELKANFASMELRAVEAERIAATERQQFVTAQAELVEIKQKLKASQEDLRNLPWVDGEVFVRGKHGADVEIVGYTIPFVARLAGERDAIRDQVIRLTEERDALAELKARRIEEDSKPRDFVVRFGGGRDDLVFAEGVDAATVAETYMNYREGAITDVDVYELGPKKRFQRVTVVKEMP